MRPPAPPPKRRRLAAGTLGAVPDNVLELIFDLLRVRADCRSIDYYRKVVGPARGLPRSAGPANKDAAALSATCVRFSSFYRLEYVEELDLSAEWVWRNPALVDQDSMTRALRRFPRVTSILFPLYPFQSTIDLGSIRHPDAGEDLGPLQWQVIPLGKRLRNPFWALAPNRARLALQYLSLDTLSWDARGLTNLLGALPALRCLSIRHTVERRHYFHPPKSRDTAILDCALRSLPKTLLTLALETNYQPSRGLRQPNSEFPYSYSISQLTPSLLPKLRELYVDRIPLTQANCAILAQLVTLRTLRLGCSTRRPFPVIISVSSFARAISQLTRLQSLCVFHVGSMSRQVRAEMCFFFESLPPTLIELIAVFGLFYKDNYVPNFGRVAPALLHMEKLEPFCFKHCPLLREVTVGRRGRINRQSWEHLLKT